MKSLFLLFALMLTCAMTFSQASCPTYSNVSIVNLGNCFYQVSFDWQNPTSGRKSIRVKLLGTTLDTCLDASNTNGSFASTAQLSTSCLPPSLYVESHTGNNDCAGTICNSTILANAPKLYVQNSVFYWDRGSLFNSKFQLISTTSPFKATVSDSYFVIDGPQSSSRIYVSVHAVPATYGVYDTYGRRVKVVQVNMSDVLVKEFGYIYKQIQKQ